MNETIIVSFSGGRTSAYMLWRLLSEYPSAKILVVFANTGKEREETLVFVAECARYWNIHIEWIEAKVNAEKGKGTEYTVTDFENASRHGEPFIEVAKKYGVPSPSFPHCSRELKIVPIRKWAQDRAPEGYQMAVGIRYDEQERLSDQWYPLLEWKVTKEMVRAFWRAQAFDLGLKDYEGNCDLCWKKSMNKKMTIIEENPGAVDWWINLEGRYGNGYSMNRNHVSYQDLKELADRGRFRRAKDDSQSNGAYGLFDHEVNCTCGVDL